MYRCLDADKAELDSMWSELHSGGWLGPNNIVPIIMKSTFRDGSEKFTMSVQIGHYINHYSSQVVFQDVSWEHFKILYMVLIKNV